jgi:hypothetical protein
MKQNVAGEVAEEHGDYCYEIHRHSGLTDCTRTPLGAAPDNRETIRPNELPPTMRQEFRHLLPLELV